MYGLPDNVLFNNPLNLRTSLIRWQGKVTPPNAEFEHFNTSFNGIRAGAKNLISYQKIHGLNTVSEIISRYAPSSENPTSSYINFMCKKLSVAPDATLDLSNPDFLVNWVIAQITFEQGIQPYEFDLIQRAVKSALV